MAPVPPPELTQGNAPSSPQEGACHAPSCSSVPGSTKDTITKSPCTSTVISCSQLLAPHLEDGGFKFLRLKIAHEAPRYSSLSLEELFFSRSFERGASELELWQWRPKSQPDGDFGHHAEALEVRLVDSSEQSGIEDAKELVKARLELKHQHVINCATAWRLKTGPILLFFNHQPGCTLRGHLQRLAATSVPEALVLRWLGQLVSLLAALHGQGLVHGALHAQNIMLTEDELSVVVGDMEYGMWRFGELGKDSPPEAHEGAPRTAAGDLWSLGSICNEICCFGSSNGRFPGMKYSGALQGLVDELTSDKPDTRPSADDMTHHLLLLPYVKIAAAPKSGKASVAQPQYENSHGVSGWTTFATSDEDIITDSGIQSLTKVLQALQADEERTEQSAEQLRQSTANIAPSSELSRDSSTSGMDPSTILASLPLKKWHLSSELREGLFWPIFEELKDHSGTVPAGALEEALRRICRALSLQALSKDEVVRILGTESNGSSSKELGYEEFRLFCESALRVFGHRKEAQVAVGKHAFVPLALPARCFSEKYEKKEKIGQGKFGSVYRCEAHHTKMQVICKVMAREKCAKSWHLVDREIDALRLLDHPHVLRLNEVFKDNECVYLVTEYCRGGELLQAFNLAATGASGSRWSERVVAEVIRQTLQAAAYCHGHGFVHRDLKLQNVLLAEPISVSNVGCEVKPHVVVADFGLAELFHSSNGRRVGVAGTPPYMAPETWQGHAGPKSDVFAIGVMAFMMLTGESPWGKVNSKQKLLEQILHGEPDWNRIKAPFALRCVQLMLRKDHRNRPDAKRLLQHEWFRAPVQCQRLLMTEANALRTIHFRNRVERLTRQMCVLHLPHQQMSRITALFDTLNTDQDGVVSLQELVKGLDRVFGRSWKELPEAVAFSEAVAMFEALDGDRSGDLSWSEFCAGCISLAEEHRDDLLWFCFREFDMDGSGFIEPQELVTVLEKLAKDGIKPNGNAVQSLHQDLLSIQKTADQMVAEMDRDKDSRISFQEFKSYVKRQLGGSGENLGQTLPRSGQ
eukprot:gnl/MRDRNA2_/MRDRNA2_35155_c0_seq1.p1 gnl/MRDRNA2_/MRDRNA2_35155_c0~~gnl/MRDRNA2_/MRDRNA2_35155_c0_seq1.p1  ORF type:complete len:1044 (-),score=193.37 gnl/MRDRNA2_/MRDRNA2_35155_c0_seq1:135-3236(-)